MAKPESFEVADYSAPREEQDPYGSYSVIHQIFVDSIRENPAHGVRVSLVDGHLKLTFHAYEMHVARRRQEVEDIANSSLAEAQKHLKKEFKKRTKKDLDLKEKKDLAGCNIQKVSMNERYYVTYWRFYGMA